MVIKKLKGIRKRKQQQMLLLHLLASKSLLVFGQFVVLQASMLN